MKHTTKPETRRIARALGGEHRGKITAGGGYFGALQLAVEVQSRFEVPKGGGRATDPRWTERRLVPLAPETLARLGRIAEQLSAQGIAIGPLQLAALVLERATDEIDARAAKRLVRAPKSA